LRPSCYRIGLQDFCPWHSAMSVFTHFLTKSEQEAMPSFLIPCSHAYIHLSPWYDPTVFDMLLM